MAQDGSRRFNWARLPLIATIAPLLCREQALEKEYLRVQYEIVWSEVPGRVRFTDDERWSLLKAALAMGGCVSDILRRNGLPPSPERLGLTWRELLARHADILLCAHIFTKEIWTLCGLRRAYVFFVLHLRIRTILLAKVTFSPDSGWLEQQVRNVLWECEERGIQPRFLLHDRDKCLCEDFDAVARAAGVGTIKTPYRSNANASCERRVRCAREECLNHMILFGIKSLRRVVHHIRSFFQRQAPSTRNREPGSDGRSHRPGVYSTGTTLYAGRGSGSPSVL